MSAMAWVACSWLLWAPGLVLASLFSGTASRRWSAGERDPFLRTALEGAYGIAFWPLAFLWTSLAGLRWTGPGVRIAFAIVSLGALAVLFLRFHNAPRPLAWIRSRPGFAAVMVAVIACTAWTRVGHVRGLVLPAWVDSVHHVMIVRLFLAHGLLPLDYDPFIPGGRFFYHWGYHAMTAALCWLLGAERDGPVAVARVLLSSGQFLNTLTPLFMYAGARALFKSRSAGLFAAVLSALVSYFPAYYVSWGRYTHLTGTLLLPAFGVLVGKLLKSPGIRAALPLSFVSAGLFLIHVRIAFFAATLAMALVAVVMRQRRLRTTSALAVSTFLTIAAVSPWLCTLFLHGTQARTILFPASATQPATWESANGIQSDLVAAPHNAELLALASGGVTALAGFGAMALPVRVLWACWGLTLAAAAHRSNRRTGNGFPARGLAVLSCWCAITVLLINLTSLGLPPLRIAPNSAALITIFVPLCAAGGALVAWVVGLLAPAAFRTTVAVTLAMILALTGAWRLRDIINPLTVLALPGDVSAMEWIRGHIPLSAKFAVRVQPWMQNAYIGADGGYWIPVLTDRGSIVPPAPYAWALPASKSATAAAFLTHWSGAGRLDEALSAELFRRGVTHLYYGVRSEAIGTSMVRNPLLRLLYQKEGVSIFELRKPAGFRLTTPRR